MPHRENIFVKPNGQSQACLSFGMARKCRMKCNINIVLGRAKRQSRAKREQNRRSSESHQACLNGRVATEENRNVKMTETFAFGEHSCVPAVASEQSSSGRRLSHLDKFNTCQWHSAGTKFGHSNIFATLSLSLSLRRSPI